MVPLAMVAPPGAIAIETSVAAETVSEVCAMRPPNAAVTVQVPTSSAVANPSLESCATPPLDELHAACPVTSCVELSE